ncbi:MAG TPA: nuclear transport factor 2 family protein [Acidimicrobiales bacterium]|jgi:hypothetical protein|nr:nuclear transport factor 2 family protein [Acidimicrobiales bacterium]
MSDDLAARLERIERRLALYDLLTTYGPAVDSGSADQTAELWAEDGSYDFGDAVLPDRQAIGKMVKGKQHQALIATGAAHLIGFPKVDIDGDRAVVTGYSQVCRWVEDRFEIWRVTANRWELTWTDGAWRVDRRQAYVLNGQERARALLRAGVTG